MAYIYNPTSDNWRIRRYASLSAPVHSFIKSGDTLICDIVNYAINVEGYDWANIVMTTGKRLSIAVGLNGRKSILQVTDNATLISHCHKPFGTPTYGQILRGAIPKPFVEQETLFATLNLRTILHYKHVDGEGFKFPEELVWGSRSVGLVCGSDYRWMDIFKGKDTGTYYGAATAKVHFDEKGYPHYTCSSGWSLRSEDVGNMFELIAEELNLDPNYLKF